MAFEIVEMPGGGILIKGKLIQKKLAAKSKRLVMLCFPKTIHDVQILSGHLTLSKVSCRLDGSVANVVSEDDQREASNDDMEIFGHISLAAISGFPLMVIGTNARTYIHFSQIQGLYDEEDLGQACCFSILTSQSEFRFVSATSTDYQKWVGALTQAFENMSATHEQPDATASPQESPNDAGSVISRPASAMSRDPDDYIEVHRAISSNRAQSRRSLSQRRQQEYQENHQQFYDIGTNAFYPPDYYNPPKKSVWSKVKTVFSAFRNKLNPDNVEGGNDDYYARNHHPVTYDKNGMIAEHQLPPSPPPKIPSRRKSIANYLGFEE